MKKTGNNQINLKQSEKMLLNCLHSEDNPSITEVKSMISLILFSCSCSFTFELLIYF